MASPTLPREGAWSGGATTTGFAVQCRTDQTTTLSIDVFIDEAMSHTASGHSVTTASLVVGQHYRGTAYVTGLESGRVYYWRVNLDNTVDAVTVGTVETATAGRVKTAIATPSSWKAVFLGCVPWVSNLTDGNLRNLIGHWDQVLAQNADFHIHVDDVYYADIGTQTAGYTDYAEGHFKRPATDADADLPAFRTNFINTWGSMGTSNAGSVVKTRTCENFMGKFKASCPGYHMVGDHEFFNDCDDRASATGDLLARWENGRDVAHEVMMNLNKSLIEADTDSTGTARTFTPYTTSPMYYVVDRAPVRFIMLDCRTYRDANADIDTTTKSMFGSEQKAWVKARIDDNKQKFLVIGYGVQLDGNHGWGGTDDDNGKSFSYERDEILDYIYTNGNAGRTIFLTGDTHEAGVFRYDKDGNYEPVYEILAGNAGWIGSTHGWVNGLKEGASGFGCTLEAMFVGSIGFTRLEYKGGDLIISLILTNQTDTPDGYNTPNTVWRKTFR